MKKLLLAFSLVCLFISCETKLYSVLVINESSKTVSYTYNGSSGILVPSPSPGHSRAYKVEAYTLPPANIKDEYGIASIKTERDGDIFTFKDAEPIIFNVANTLPFEITLKADNYICWVKGSNSYELELSIPAQEEIKDYLFIYTENPEFTTESDYPVKFDWNITDLLNESGDPILDDSEKPKKKLSLVIK